jgi:stalled ribosome alternative rescue factor ArfA
LRNSNGSSQESYNTKINATRTRGLNPTKSHTFCAKKYPPETLNPNETRDYNTLLHKRIFRSRNIPRQKEIGKNTYFRQESRRTRVKIRASHI